MAGNVNVSFVCQRCLQPLILDSTFGNVDEHRIAELSRKLPRNSLEFSSFFFA